MHQYISRAKFSVRFSEYNEAKKVEREKQKNKHMKLKYPSTQTLLPFQIEAINQMCEFLQQNTTNGVYNACEMGLGKSVQAIVALNTLGLKRTLIICPSVMKLTWRDELKKWSTNWPGNGHSVSVIESSRDIKKHRDGNPFTIISYHLVRQSKVAKELANGLYDSLILDECIAVKSTKAKTTTEVLRNIWPKIKYRICLCGTPFTQSILDAYTLFSRLAPQPPHPEAFPDYYKFAYRYTNVQKTPWGDKFTGIKKADELKTLIRKNFFVRYRKSEVLKDLPEKQWSKISLPSSYLVKQTAEETAEETQYLQALRSLYANSKNGSVPSFIPQPPKNLMRKRREQGLAKLPAIIEFIQGFVDAKIPLVVFGVHIEFLKKLKQAFDEQRPGFIIGETPSASRYEDVKSFQEGKTDLIFLQLVAGGVGITLTRSSTVLLGEMSFSPAEIGQAVDRVHRIGQRDSVMVYYPIVEGSLDEKLEDIVVSKAKAFKEVLQ